MELLIFVALVAGAIYLILIRRKPTPGDDAPRRDDPVSHAHKQLTQLNGADLSASGLLNKSEEKLLAEIDACLAAHGVSLRVMAQVSMGAMIKTKARPGAPAYAGLNAYRAVNSKRVDFALVDDAGRVRLVIEFDGPSHERRATKARDAVKTEALKRAGIPLLVIDYRENEAARAERLRTAITAL